jgi:hypothetical protein
MNKKQKAAAQKAAQDLNFYGKRLRDKRLQCCERMISENPLLNGLDASVLEDWLLDNQPAKPEKAKREKAAGTDKPAAATIAAGVAALPQLPALVTSDRVIITAAQNNTAPDPAVWAELQRVAAALDAQIIVCPIWYNKNAFSAAAESEKEYFDPAFTPYLQTADFSLFDGRAIVHAAAAILATAKQPVTTPARLNAGELVTVAPATKQQMRTLPRSPAMPVKEAWTTGTVTGINYTRSRAGTEAAADHCFGGVLLEMGEDGKLASYNLTYKAGSIACIGLDQPAVVVLGDLHCERKDPAIWSETLHYLNCSQPSLIVVHDILHFETASHHNRNKGDHLYRMQDRLVLDDLRTVIEDLNTLAEIAPTMIVESNHNSALDNWLHDLSYQPKRDPKQAKLYYLLNYLFTDAVDQGVERTALQLAFENLDRFDALPELSDAVTWGRKDVSFMSHGFELSQHGHHGQNGASGSASQFKRWQVPMVTGHTHSPLIDGGRNPLFTVGVTASLDQGYNRGGASTWNQSHAAIYDNGSAQIIPIRRLF